MRRIGIGCRRLAYGRSRSPRRIRDDNMTFTHKTFVITGASAGIGQALAIQLAQRGANLVLAARNQAALETTAEACIKAGGKAIAVPTDVTNSEACRNLIESAVKTFGAIASSGQRGAIARSAAPKAI